MSATVTTLLTSIASMLANKGFSLLTDIISDATESGLEEAANFLQEKTGISISGNLSDSDYDSIQDAVWKYQTTLKQIALEHHKLAVRNTEGARQMHMDIQQSNLELQKAGRPTNWLAVNFIYILGIIITLLSFGFFFGITFFSSDVSTTGNQYVNQVMSNLMNILLIIVTFFFGSAWGEKKANSENEKSQDSINQNIQTPISPPTTVRPPSKPEFDYFKTNS